MQEKLQKLLVEMLEHVKNTKQEETKFRERAIYSNPGDTHYLGQLQLDIQSTDHWLKKIKEILGE